MPYKTLTVSGGQFLGWPLLKVIIGARIHVFSLCSPVGLPLLSVSVCLSVCVALGGVYSSPAAYQTQSLLT